MNKTKALAATAFKTIAEELVNWAAESAMADRIFRSFVDGMLRVQVTLLRTELEIALMCRWHVPNDTAYWLAQHWPKRWLPKLKPEL